MDSPNLYEETVRIATELYEKSGRVEGRDLENWMEAEKIVLAATSMSADDDSNEDDSNGEGNGNGNGNSYEEIEKVATELYEKSGQTEGCDLENWLKAERIVKEGEQFCKMFMQMLVQSPLSACKLMEAIKLLLDLEQKQELERLIGSA
jgi:endogenous inhibitor of DNA gyrase (YacG/DUF329 family)